MLNQVVLVGRIAQDLEIKEQENGKKVILNLAVKRSFKNSNGEYETDFIPCILCNGIADKTIEYCRKNDLIGVKGRLQTKDNNVIVIAEKVTFLSNKSE